jgi:hypothetical protein
MDVIQRNSRIHRRQIPTDTKIRKEIETMKALSIKQPWAGMIIDGYKDIEIRSWGPKNNRLPMRIAIVSSKQPSPYIPDLEGIGYLNAEYYRVPGLMPRGFILGDALLVEIKTYYDLEAFHTDRKRHRNPDDLFFPGARGWRFEDIRPRIIPKPYQGRLSLYEIPDNELD